MREFKLLRGFFGYLNEISLPMITRAVARPIAEDMEVPDRLRCVDGRLNNIEFRVYTHLSVEEVQRIVQSTISHFLYEPNIPINRWEMVRLLERRFHRAYIITH